MATVTHEIGTADTGVTPNTSGAFVPVVGDLLIVFVVVSDSADTGIGSLTGSLGLTFTLIQTATYRTSLDKIFVYVSDALVSNAASQTVTWNGVSDEGTGSIIFVEAVAGMSRVGLDAILQNTRQNNQAAGTPAPVFAANVNTNNVTIGVIGNSTSPAGLTPPTSWTEPATTGDLGYSNPTTGGEVVFRNSGFTGTTITWGSASASAFGSLIIELDTSVPAAEGTLSVTLGDLTLSGVGDSLLSGTLESTLDAATLSAIGDSELIGNASNTLAELVLSSSGTVEDAGATGILDLTLGALVLESVGIEDVTGALSSSLDSIGITSEGSIPVGGDLSLTLDLLTLSSAGTVQDAEITGELNSILDSISLSSLGETEVIGSLSATLNALTLNASESGGAVELLLVRIPSVTIFL